MPTKRLMGFVIGINILMNLAYFAPKMVALRHAREDTGLSRDVALAVVKGL